MPKARLTPWAFWMDGLGCFGFDRRSSIQSGLQLNHLNYFPSGCTILHSQEECVCDRVSAFSQAFFVITILHLSLFDRCIAIWHNNYIFEHVSQRKEDLFSNSKFDTIVYGNFIHNSQTLENIQMSFNGWMDAQSVVHPYHVIYSAIKMNEQLIHETTWLSL